VFLPLVVLLVVLVILHLLISVLMPFRWPAIRNEFQKQLVERVRQELEAAFLPVPEEVAAALLKERAQAEALLKETGEVAGWLRQREQASGIAGLYGK